MGILIDRELKEQQLWMRKKKTQTNSHTLSISRQEAGSFGNKQTIKIKIKKWNACKFEATSQ